MALQRPDWWQGGGNIDWPPAPWRDVYRRYEEHAAWFGGDPGYLAAAYRGQAATSNLKTNFDRFWASASMSPLTRRMLHAPLAGDISTTSSDLLFSEPPQLIAGEVQDRMDELTEELHIFQTLAEAAEGVSALGGGYLRVMWAKEFQPDYPLFDAIYADSAIPEWQWGTLQAVNFQFKVIDPNEKAAVYRKVERHEPGLILHKLFRGTDAQLGDAIPLATLAEFVGLDEVVETGFDGMTAVYVPNMRPNRVFRGMPLGRSDYDGVEAMMDALDEVWTSWMRDLRLARARLIVSQELVESRGKGKGSKLDLDQEVWESLPFSSQNVEKMITPSQFAIRTEQHAATADALVERIVSAAGYAAATFGLHAEKTVSATATEIINRERRTFITRAKKISYFEPPLRRILEALLAVDAAQFNTGNAVVRPTIKWPDSLQVDMKETSTIAQALRTAKAASTETLVKMQHDDWTQEQVDAEVKKIKDENMQAAPQPPKLPQNPREGNPDPGMPVPPPGGTFQ